MFYTCNYNIRVTHRNGAIKHIFYTNQITEGSSADCSLFILSLHALALHLAVKILLQIFLYEDLSTLALHTSVSCISLQNASRTALCYATILLSENIPNIWHKSSTKHKEVRPDWNDKNDNANYAPSYHMEGFTNGSGCHFKEIFDQVRKDLDCELFYSELKRHNVSHYIYYLATDNIHIVLENDNTVLIKGLKKVVNVKFSKNTSCKTSYDRLKSEITFQQYRKILLKQEFSDGLQISMNIKDITIPLIIHYYLLRAFRTLHKSFR